MIFQIELHLQPGNSRGCQLDEQLEHALSFPLASVQDVVLLFHDGLPFVSTSVLTNESQECLTTIFFSLVGLDRICIIRTSRGFF